MKDTAGGKFLGGYDLLILLLSYFCWSFRYLFPILADLSQDNRGDNLFNDDDNLFESVEEEEYTDLDFAFDFDVLEEFEEQITMPLSSRKLMTTAKEPVTCCSTIKIDANDLASSMGKISIRTPYSFN